MQAGRLADAATIGIEAGKLINKYKAEPAEDDVGADSFFIAVVDRPQVDDLLQRSRCLPSRFSSALARVEPARANPAG